MGLKLDTPIQYVKGIGPKLAELLARRQIHRVLDLLEYYPRAFEDRRAARNISSLVAGELVSLRAQIQKVNSFALSSSRRRAYDLVLSDQSGVIHCKFFRLPYKGFFERLKPGQWVRVVGRPSDYRGKLEFNHPDLRDLDSQIGDEADGDDDKIIPIYSEIEALSSAKIRRIIQNLLSLLKEQAEPRPAQQLDPGRGRKSASEPPGLEPTEEPLPLWARQKCNLIERFTAWQLLHEPSLDLAAGGGDLAVAARRRLIFEEFFWLELSHAWRKTLRSLESSLAIHCSPEWLDQLTASLPYELTEHQRRALGEIVQDLARSHPTQRLLQGDVGSGKTVLALLAAALAAKQKLQTALMAPTEILAEQHARNARQLLAPQGIRVELLTGQVKGREREAILARLKQNEIDLLIGTHALIESQVQFHSLALAIIDEQHRFGVDQRNRLKQKGLSPHFLIMTATPIPRTLAMTAYGDLEVSLIKELPRGRQPIQTRVIYDNKRAQALDFIAQQLARGRQAYVVYPLIEESEKIDLKNAVAEYEKLVSHFSQFRLGLLHGRMRAEEKDAVMAEFRRGTLQLLVSTTVIEVGVDVPNANIIMIEHAERFGLSQLHQLRGRVGRGSHKSFCILVMGHAVSEDGHARLKIMEQSNDGFLIAEKDLEIRGPGEFLGHKQSGLTGFKLASLLRDSEILQEARSLAFALIEKDPQLSLPENQQLRRHFEFWQSRARLAFVG